MRKASAPNLNSSLWFSSDTPQLTFEPRLVDRPDDNVAIMRDGCAITLKFELDDREGQFKFNPQKNKLMRSLF